MTKSKLRGGAKAHRKKVQQRNINKKVKETKARKEFMEMMQKAQKEYENKQENKNVVTAEEMGDIGDGLELNLEEDNDFVMTDDFVIKDSDEKI